MKKERPLLLEKMKLENIIRRQKLRGEPEQVSNLRDMLEEVKLSLTLNLTLIP